MSVQQVNITYMPVDSSQVAAWGYDPIAKVLGVKFKSGGTYHYKNVTIDVADLMAKAESLGKFVGANLRNKYEYERVSDDGQHSEGLPLAQEPKYTTGKYGRLYNRDTAKQIPDDEPVIILRAKDKHAIKVLEFYADLVSEAQGASQHLAVVEARVAQFTNFAQAHPDRMKEPDTTVAA